MATITITFESDETRCGKTLIAKALFNQLEELGYDVEYDFTEETKKLFSLRHIIKRYLKCPFKEFKLSELINPKTKVIIIPE